MTIPHAKTHCAAPGTPLRAALRWRLLSLSYRAYLECLCVLLDRAGYRSARPAGRRDWKGFNRPGGGGFDIEAALPGGLGPRPVVVQAKQFDALPVFQRSVDELRGACLRAGAAEALLVTTSTFSSVVRRAASPASVAPVRLLDGDGLVGLLLAHRVGVWEEVGEKESEPGRVEVDEAFFDSLAAAFPQRPHEAALSRNEKPNDVKWNKLGAAPSWTVTVRVGGPGIGPAATPAVRERR